MSQDLQVVSCGQGDPAPTNALVGKHLFWVFIWMKPNSAPIGVLVGFEEKPRFIYFHIFSPPLCSSCSSSSLFFSFFPCNKSFELLILFFYSFCDGAHWCVFGFKGCQGATIAPSTIFYVSLILRNFLILKNHVILNYRW